MPALFLAGVICLSQPYLLSLYAQWAELPWRHCSLPVGALGWALLMLLGGIACARYLPRGAAALAFCGRWMLFIYAAHSFLLAPLYGGYNPHFLWNIWVPLLVIPLLAAAGWSVAVANGRKEVRAHCCAVCEDNNHDGVARYLAGFFGLSAEDFSSAAEVKIHD